MNEKVEKMLYDMNLEILAKVDAIVNEKDAEIKERAKKAYDDSVKDSIDAIRADVEKEYSMARKYLESLREPELTEPVANGLEPDAPVAEAPVADVPADAPVADASVTPVL